MLEDVGAISTTSRPPVGVPIHEVALQEAIGRQFSRLFAPGAGRSVFFITEPELGFGRPDAVLLTLSVSSLNAFLRRGLRLPSLNAAKSLAGGGTNLTDKHARSLARQLERSGWSERALKDAGGVITDSLAVEAKLAEWRRATRQAAGYRVGAGRSVVLLPARVGALEKQYRRAASTRPASNSPRDRSSEGASENDVPSGSSGRHIDGRDVDA